MFGACLALSCTWEKHTLAQTSCGKNKCPILEGETEAQRGQVNCLRTCRHEWQGWDSN